MSADYIVIDRDELLAHVAAKFESYHDEGVLHEWLEANGIEVTQDSVDEAEHVWRVTL